MGMIINPVIVETRFTVSLLSIKQEQRVHFNLYLISKRTDSPRARTIWLISISLKNRISTDETRGVKKRKKTIKDFTINDLFKIIDFFKVAAVIKSLSKNC